MAQVCPAKYLSPTATTTTKNIPKDITKKIAESIGVRTKTTTSLACFYASVSELIICGTLTRIGKHFIGFFCLLEGTLCLWIIRITVWVVLHGQTPIGFLQLSLTSISAAA
jgi:hypothetical protein